MPISQTCRSILSVIAIVLFSSAAGYSSDRPAEHMRSGEHQTDQGYHHSFGQAGVWAKKFDDPSRDAWQKPEQILDALNLGPTARVADLGAGTGYFSVRIAKRLPEGKVFAIDIEPEMLRYLSERARREHLSTVIPVVANEETPNIPEPVDLILVVDTYHHIDDRIAYFNRLRKSLNPGGRLAIVDFKMESPEGPPPEHRVSAEKVTEELKAAGYSLVAAPSFLPRQYFLVFTAPPS
jgi:SAM-dependent methyltransferase